jgi:DNA-binding transcriptional LysR family regulator
MQAIAFSNGTMELRHIRYFIAVAEELNFTRAAAKIGIGQPPLSLQIRSLEEELGEPLFRRLSHGAELTAAGRAFLPEARKMIALAQRAKRTAQRGARGEIGQLRLGFTSSASYCRIVPATLRAFRSEYPEVELSLQEADTTRLLEHLTRENIDAGFIRPGLNDPTGVRLHRLGEEAMVIALPSKHSLAKSARLSLSALAGESFVLFPRDAGPAWFDEVIAACRQAGFEPILGQEAPQISSVGNLVAAELGVALVPASIASQVKVTGIKYVQINGDAPVARLALAVRPGEHSVIVQNFLALAASGTTENL